jgi:putative transcriptional regulator
MTAQSRPNHHPCCNTLLRHAAGTLSPAMHLLIATHLTYCPQCRQELQAYESQAGLGLELLPPEELDVSCLNNLLTKIDESGPIACIDVTIPIHIVHTYRYPEPLQPFVGITGEHIRWEQSQGHSHWAIRAARSKIIKIEAAQNVAAAWFEKGAMVLILNGGFQDKRHIYHAGDIVWSRIASHATTTADTLCLIIKPEKNDKPNWLQCLMSFISGDKK